MIIDEHGPVTAAVREVARRRQWPSSWLNEQASAYMPTSPDPHQTVVFDAPTLRVLAASPERLLAMKARAARATDRSDILHLAALTGAQSADTIARVVESVFPGEPMSDRSRKVIEDLLADTSHDDRAGGEE